MSESERGPSGTGHDTAGWVGLQRPTRVAHAPEPDPAADPVVSPADTIRRAQADLAGHREHAEWVRDYLRVSDMDGFSAHSLNERLLTALDIADALLAVGERDRQQIARLTEALERIAAEESFTVDHEYGDFEAIRADDMLASVRAVLAGEEDAGDE